MKGIFLVLLLLYSINGYCEWTLFHTSNIGKQYVEFSTIKKNGKYLRVWDLINYNDNKSQITLSEFDCDEEKTRYLGLVSYSGPMGTGISRDIETPNSWRYEIPNSSGHQLLKKVCNIFYKTE